MTSLAKRLLAWYREHGRHLPWRGSREPYAVWVSEVMLQQTRVEVVTPYFASWMQRFPDLSSLAAAFEQDVLRVWEGMGYYSRARNLYRASKIVMSEYKGELPRDVKTLRRLPGIGAYIAGAIASIAYGMDEPALDGNIRRVFARLFDVQKAVNTPEAEHILRSCAAEHLPPGRAGDFNQAMMDLGATICTPRNPDCRLCPINDLCRAYILGIQAERPVVKPKPAVPHYTVVAAAIRRDGRVLLARRPSKGLLGGLWEFPGGRVEAGEDLTSAIKREIREELGIGIHVGEHFGVYQHAYTHFRFTLHAFLCYLKDGEPRPLEADELCWVTPSELSAYPMGKVDRRIARKLSVDECW